MKRERFWEIVAAVGWGTEHTDCDKGKKILRELLPDVETMQAFREHKCTMHDALYSRISEWEDENDKSCGLGDDGFGDLISHIIGLGPEEVENVQLDPELALKRAHSRDFSESFAHCVPYESDYLPESEKLTNKIDSLRRWADDLDVQILSSYEHIENLKKKKVEVGGQLSEAFGNLRQVLIQELS